MGLVAAAIFITGCATPHVPIEIPPKPVLEPVTADNWPCLKDERLIEGDGYVYLQCMTEEDRQVVIRACETWSSNQLAQKEYIERLIRRIEIHNGNE